jgi:hypothetical protein
VQYAHGQQAEVRRADFDSEEDFNNWRMMVQEDFAVNWRVLYKRAGRRGTIQVTSCAVHTYACAHRCLCAIDRDARPIAALDSALTGPKDTCV